MRVVLIFTPSEERALIALRPSGVIWIFTTTFLWSLASWRPCLIISSAWVVVTSREIGPSTRARMSWITSDHFRPVFATSVGFVVTPSRTPQEAASRISSMFAVSRKIFTMNARRRPMAWARYEHFRLRGDVVSLGAGQATYPDGPCGRLTALPRRSGATRTSGHSG